MQADEQILRLRQAIAADQNKQASQAKATEDLEQELAQSIYNGTVRIFNQERVFAERSLFDGLASIWLPESFAPLPPELIRQVYPIGQPPQLVLTEEPYLFSAVFTHQDTPLDPNQLPEYAQMAVTVLERVGPKVNLLENTRVECGSEPAVRLHFTSMAIDMAITNVQLMASVERRLFIANIHFPFTDSKRLVPLAREILSSFRKLEPKEHLT